MINTLTKYFNDVYHERKHNNPDDVPANNLTPNFIKRVNEKLKDNFYTPFDIHCLAGSNTSLIFMYALTEYYCFFDYDNDEFKIQYNY